MKRVFSVVALSVALGLSTMGFRSAGNNEVAADCEATNDLTVTADLENMSDGSGEIKGMIVNQSSDNEYDDVLVRVDFYGADLTSPDDMEEMDTDIETDTDRDLDVDVDEGDLDVDYQSEAEMETDNDMTMEMETERDDASLGTDRALGSRVITIDEDVEAGEVEEFALDVTPPAGTTRVVTSIVCAD